MDTFEQLQQADGDKLILEQFKKLFQNSSDAIFITDHAFILIETNKAFDVLFRSMDGSQEDLTMSDLVMNGFAYNEILNELKQHNILRNKDVSLTDTQGELIHASISIIQMRDDGGELLGFQGIIRDETSRIKAQRKLAKAEKAVLTGRMVRVIAHEIRNPLTNITLALANLDLENRTDEERLMMKMIGNNSDRINDLITELLDSSRPAELELEPKDVSDLLKDALALAADRIELHNVQLVTTLLEETTIIHVDVPKMTLALNNLFINAIEAMEDGGTLTVSVIKRVEAISISITDTGNGIPKEKISQLFDPFFSDKHGSTGLGLTTVQNIIQSHDWNIDVESEGGEGTTFYLTIDH